MKGQRELVLEKYVWVPYMDYNVIDEDMKQLIETYLQIIEGLMEKKTNILISHRINEFNALLVTNGFNFEHLILKTIVENLNTSAVGETTRQLITSDGKHLSSDLLNNLYFEEWFLRPVLDIVLENNSLNTTDEFNVLEINLNQELCYQKVINYLINSFHNIDVIYTVYNPFQRGSDVNEKNNSYEKIDINFTIETEISNNTPIDLFIIRDPFPSEDNNLVSYEDIFRYINNNLKVNGFVVILKRNEWTQQEKTVFKYFGYNFDDILTTSQLISMAEDIGLALVSHRSDSMTSSVLLFRKIIPNVSTDVIFRVTHSELHSWFEMLKNEITSDPMSKNKIWLASDGESGGGIVGFVKCLRKEPGGHRIRCISDLSFANLFSTPSASSIDPLIDRSIFDKDLVMNIYRSGELGSYRHLTITQEGMSRSQIRHKMINSNENSMFDWFESKPNFLSERDLNCEQNILIDVYYVGINGSDSLKEGMGLCSEFSGVDVFGRRYLGIKSNACLSTIVFKNKNDLLSIPDHWSLAQACTVPIAYGTCYLALVVRAQIQKQQSILIHSVDEYMGWAALVLAQSLHLDIYVTVRSVDSKNALLAKFSDLNKSKIINTSMDCFQEIVFNRTGGKGVDVVFDYTNHYNLDSNIFCVKQNGIYITDNLKDLDEKRLTNDKNISIINTNIFDVFNESNDNCGEEGIGSRVLRLVNDGISDNIVKPLDSRVFSADVVNQALDYLTMNSNKEKVLVRLKSDEHLKEVVVRHLPRGTKFSGDRTYLITGGLGGFGLELAHWMVIQGARNLLLASRSGVQNYFQEFNVERLRALGAQVVISQLNAETEEECYELLSDAMHLAPVGGIFSLAEVLSDGLFVDQTSKSMEKVFAPKVQTLKHLDIISRHLCPELQYFVAFSSVSSGRGNGGQSNSGYANSFVERVCEMRRMDGLPALAIQWGAVADRCVVSETVGTEALKDSAISTSLPQCMHSCLSVLNHFLHCTDSVVSSLLRDGMNAIKDAKTYRFTY